MAVTVDVDGRRRRVVVHLPCSVTEFAASGWLMPLVRRVCGEDAIADALVGAKLGALALCAKGENQVWRDELKLSDESNEGEE